jgi:Holliday junction DNA helicase RuvB
MKLILRFQFYAEEELAVILHQRSANLGWLVEAEVLPLIAQRARGTPRLALRLLQSCRRVCRAEGEKTITLEHLERACELEGIDALGLGPTEQQYLRALAEGASRLHVIASMMGLPPRTISQVTEPFLLRIGLMVNDQGKRVLTQKGHEHLAESRPLGG